jgi:hypothetical protein
MPRLCGPARRQKIIRERRGALLTQINMQSVWVERDTTAKVLAPEIAAAVKLPLEQVGLAPFDR